MSTSVVNQSLALGSYAVEVASLSKRIALQTARSWTDIVASAFPGDQTWPWTIIDATFESAESFVSAQTYFGRSVLDATATALGVLPTKGAPPIAARAEIERTSATPKPAKVEAATAPVSVPKPVAKVEAATASVSVPKPVAKVEAATAPVSVPKPAAKAEAATAAPSKPNAPTKTVAAKPKAPKASGGTKTR